MSDATAAQRERLFKVLDGVARAQIGVAVVIGLLGLVGCCGVTLSSIGGPCPTLPNPGALGAIVLLWAAVIVFAVSGGALWSRLGRRAGGYSRPLLAGAGVGLLWGAVHAGLLVWGIVASSQYGSPVTVLWGGGPWLHGLLRVAVLVLAFFATALPFFVGAWSGWTWYRWRALLE